MQILSKHATESNLFLLNTGKLSSQLSSVDPTLEGVHITKQWPNAILVDATQKQPVIGWVTGDQRYLLDRSGAIIGNLPDNSKLLTVTDDSNLPVSVGQKVVTRSFVTFCSDLETSLPSIGIKPKSFEVKETTFDLYVNSDQGYQLIFDTTRPAADEVADLKTVLTTLGGKRPSQYIDMRIEGKAYYK